MTTDALPGAAPMAELTEEHLQVRATARKFAEEVVRLSAEYQARGVGVVAISSNDIARFPEDAPARMAEVTAAMGFTAPYLYDETQAVATAYHAVCTPDFFAFDAERRLASEKMEEG